MNFIVDHGDRMDPVFKKMQYKNQDRIYVLNSPDEFKPHLDEISRITSVKKSPNCK
jgi:hypothetical protein